jgi:hypothetical protein
MTTERNPSSLYDEEPGSQGEIEAGSEGDFGDPASSPSAEDRTDPGDTPDAANDEETRVPAT